RRQPGLHGPGARADRPTAEGKGGCMSADDRSESRIPPKRGLGRGLGALLGEARREEPLVSADSESSGGDHGGSEAKGPVRRGEGLASLPVAAIEPPPSPPRPQFTEA